MFQRPFKDTLAMAINQVLFIIFLCRSTEGLSIAPELDIHKTLGPDSNISLG